MQKEAKFCVGTARNKYSFFSFFSNELTISISTGNFMLPSFLGTLVAHNSLKLVGEKSLIECPPLAKTDAIAEPNAPAPAIDIFMLLILFYRYLKLQAFYCPAAILAELILWCHHNRHAKTFLLLHKQ